MKNLRYFIETCAVKALAFSMRSLPRHAILVLAKIVGAVAYAADYRGRAAALENLRVAFDDTLSWSERHRITRRSYQNFARTFFDLFWAGTLTMETWRDHFVIDSPDPEVFERMAKGGIVWITPHFGNFELMGLSFGWLGAIVPVVAQNFKNPALTEIFKEARQASGHSIIPSESAIRSLLRTLASGGHAAFLTDLNVKPGRASTSINCFGLKTCVTILHVVCAQRLNLSIGPVVCIPMDDGRYILRYFPLIPAQPEKGEQYLAQQCWDVFEKQIRAQPELWMWMYKHWRYLPGDDTDALYPDYANKSKPFAKLVRGK